MTKTLEPLILSIDTATEKRSIALVCGEQTLGFVKGDEHKTHSAHLLSDIDEALRQAGATIKEVDLFAIATGPGSFTGLRAGLATVKAFVSTLNRPAVGIPTLHLIASAAGQSARSLAMLPAGRGEVFAQLLAVGPDGSVSELDQPVHVAPERLLEMVASQTGLIKLAESGALRYSQLIREFAAAQKIDLSDEEDPRGVEKGAGWILARPVEYLAVHLAAMARAFFKQGFIEEATELHAVYVRASDAELKERC